MHELSIAQNIFRAVSSALDQHGGGAVLRVRIRVGELSGVEVESLKFCYEATVNETRLAGSVLDVELVHAEFLCGECGNSFRPDGFNRQCPSCGAAKARLETGTELEIVDFEVG